MRRATRSRRAQPLDRIAATGAALVIVGLAVVLLIRNEPIADPRLFFVLRVVLSFSAATLGATIPGFLNVGWSAGGFVVRAGGALALFVLTFVYTPNLVADQDGGSKSQIATGAGSVNVQGDVKAPVITNPVVSIAGTCSPIYAGNATNVAITLNCSFGGGSFEVELVRANLACNEATEVAQRTSDEPYVIEPVTSVRDLFKQLQHYDDRFVYVDLFIWVGDGCGLKDIWQSGSRISDPPVWGVNYELDLDGFTGNWEDYKYGYTIAFEEYVEELTNNKHSTILFPKQDTAFFTARYGKALFMEGLAKIKVSEIQGFQYIEIVPVVPFGSLADSYSKFKKYLRNAYPAERHRASFSGY